MIDLLWYSSIPLSSIFLIVFVYTFLYNIREPFPALHRRVPLGLMVPGLIALGTFIGGFFV
jgi:uncharacterized membrane protein